jgi:two-component system KDP operon response regulator KdpE
MLDKDLILIVEDDLQISEFMQFSLDAHGFKTNSTTLLSDAIHSFQRQKPKLILLDLNLPDGDG